MSLHNITRNMPFAISSNFIPQHLPIDGSDFEYSSPNAEFKDFTGPFGRQAQACRLLDKVVNILQTQIPGGPVTLVQKQKKELDGQMCHLMGHLIGQKDGNSVGYCESTAILLSCVAPH